MKKTILMAVAALALVACGGGQGETALPINTVERTVDGVNQFKNTYEYDAAGNVTRQIRLEWNARLNDWQEIIKYENTYDGSGNRLTQTLSTKVDSVTWINSSKYEAQYNSANKVTAEQWYAWNEQGQKWVENVRYSYQYDANNMRTQETSQSYNSATGQWENGVKVDYKNASKVESNVTTYDWKDGNWVERTNDLYTYDKNGSQICIVYQAKDSTNAWKPFSKKEYEYDERGRLVNEKTYRMTSSGEWTNMNKITTDYDQFGNRRRTTTFLPQGNVWRVAQGVVYDNEYQAKEESYETDYAMKTVFITGASSGIGEACARKFASEGHRLILNARRAERLEELKAQIIRDTALTEKDILLLPFDVREREVARQAIANLPAEWQAIDILVNNAGLALGLEKEHEGDFADWDTMIDTNISALLSITRFVVPGMVARGKGHIINIGSVAGDAAYANGAVYCATKAAVKVLSDGLRIDLVDTPIRVTTIKPGLVETNFSVTRFHGDQARADKVYQGIEPLTGADIADCVYFAASAPEHVQVAEILVLANNQASGSVIYRK